MGLALNHIELFSILHQHLVNFLVSGYGLLFPGHGIIEVESGLAGLCLSFARQHIPDRRMGVVHEGTAVNCCIMA